MATLMPARPLRLAQAYRTSLYADPPLQCRLPRSSSRVASACLHSSSVRWEKSSQPADSTSSSSSSSPSSPSTSQPPDESIADQFWHSTPQGGDATTLPHTNRTPSFPPKNFPSAFGANQVLTVPIENQNRLAKIVSSFSTPIRFAFAYGSGVFPQSAAGPEHTKRPAIKDEKTGQPKKMVDLILAVSHPEHWHGLNRTQFTRHYSWISRVTGAEFFTGWIQRLGAGLWYIPYVRVEDELIKYGVIDIDTLCNDLLDWDTLYVSGRMHKPVAMVIADSRVRLAQQVNLASALRVALLLLPQTFTEVELYTRIASLSYTGDFRMSVPGGENANKVRNIVLAQRNEFRRLYSGLMHSLGTIDIKERRQDRYYMVQDTSPEIRAGYAARLPLRLREKVIAHYTSRPDLDPAFLKLSVSTKDSQLSRKPRPLSTTRPGSTDKDKDGAHSKSPDSLAPQEVLDAFWLSAVKQSDFAQVLLTQIAKTVKGPAWSQSLKGAYTAGMGRTLKYVAAKVGKWFEGKDQEKNKAKGDGDGDGK